MSLSILHLHPVSPTCPPLPLPFPTLLEGLKWRWATALRHFCGCCAEGWCLHVRRAIFVLRCQAATEGDDECLRRSVVWHDLHAVQSCILSPCLSILHIFHALSLPPNLDSPDPLDVLSSLLTSLSVSPLFLLLCDVTCLHRLPLPSGPLWGARRAWRDTCCVWSTIWPCSTTSQVQ